MKFIACIMATALAFSASATAQRAPGSSATPDYANETLDKITTYREMNNCQMKPNIDAAKALLASTTMDEASRNAARFRWLACTLKTPSRDFMTVTPNNSKLDELRWMSADYFLVRDAAAVAALQPIPRQVAYNYAWFAATKRDDSIDAMAACVADTNPAGILALNHTVIGSSEERGEFRRLASDFASCLQAGVTMNGDRKALRGALIDAIYQRTQQWPAPQAAAPGGAN